METKPITIYAILSAISIAIVLLCVFFGISIDVNVEHGLQGPSDAVYKAILDGRSASEIDRMISLKRGSLEYSFNGKSVMTIAIREGRIDVVDILLKHGYSPNEQDIANHPLSSCMHYNKIDVAKHLLERGSDPTLGNPSPIDKARQRERREFIHLFEQGG